MYPPDRPVADRFSEDLRAGRGGVYAIHAVAAGGDRFRLRVCSLATHTGMRGRCVLEAYDLVRRHFPIRNAVLQR